MNSQQDPSRLRNPGHIFSLRILRILLLCALALSPFMQAQDNPPGQQAPAAEEYSVSGKEAADDRKNPGNWRYSVLPEDTIWSISNAYLAENYSWIDLIRFNHLQRANQVVPGATLLIPLNWLKLQPAPAIAISVTGEALLKRSQQSSWVTLEENFYLHVGDTIKTFKGSVLVRFADESVLRLEQDTVLIFNRLTQFGKSGMTDTGLRLEKGRVSTKVKPNRENGSRYEISTPSAVAAVRGTEFRVDADNKGTDLEVIEGVVEFSIRDQKLNVPAGYSVSAPDGENLSPPAKLLAAPLPGDLPTAAETLPVNLRWAPVKGAASYRYAVYADSADGKQVLTGIGSSPSFTIGYLPNGNYAISIRGVTVSGSEGLDATHWLRVGVTAKPATLVSPLPDQIFNNVQPVFRWSDPHQHQQARLEIAKNIDFDPVIVESDYIQSSYAQLDFKLPPGQYFWRVRTLASKDSEALSDSRALGVRGILPPGEIISVNYNDERAKVFWKTIPDAQSYRVQLATSADFHNDLHEESTTEPNISLRLQKATTYYIRVKGIGSDLFSSDFGPARELRLTDTP
jgi:hypothetical protein